jgi:hypothetical protein
VHFQTPPVLRFLGRPFAFFLTTNANYEQSHWKSSKSPVWGEPQIAKILLVLFDPAAPFTVDFSRIFASHFIVLAAKCVDSDDPYPSPNG